MKPNLPAIFRIAICLPVLCFGKNPEIKSLKVEGGINSFKAYILPIVYDSTVSDQSLMKMVDTIPAIGYPLAEQIYVITDKNDSTKPAVMIYKNKVYGTANWKFMIQELYPNGNPKRISTYDKNLKAYPVFCEAYDNMMVKTKGHYLNGIKIKRWKYFDPQGRKLETEIYRNGVVRKTKTFRHPRKTLFTCMQYTNKKGVDYILR